MSNLTMTPEFQKFFRHTDPSRKPREILLDIHSFPDISPIFPRYHGTTWNGAIDTRIHDTKSLVGVLITTVAGSKLIPGNFKTFLILGSFLANLRNTYVSGINARGHRHWIGICLDTFTSLRTSSMFAFTDEEWSRIGGVPKYQPNAFTRISSCDVSFLLENESLPEFLRKFRLLTVDFAEASAVLESIDTRKLLPTNRETLANFTASLDRGMHLDFSDVKVFISDVVKTQSISNLIKLKTALRDEDVDDFENFVRSVQFRLKQPPEIRDGERKSIATRKQSLTLLRND